MRNIINSKDKQGKLTPYIMQMYIKSARSYTGKIKKRFFFRGKIGFYRQIYHLSQKKCTAGLIRAFLHSEKVAPMRRGPRQPALHGVLRRGDGHAARLRPNYLAREAGRAARMASYLASASFPGSPACTATAMTSAGVGSIRSWMDVVRKPLMPSLGSRS